MKEPPLIFISGLKSEFGEIRSRLKEFCDEYLGLEVLIFEREDVPGALPSVEECEDWGRNSNLFILVAGKKYGNLCPNGRSFTELEYDAALQDNPQKIRAFVKTVHSRESRQQEFIHKVGSGRRYREFVSDEELMKLVPKTIVRFLINPVEMDDLPVLKINVAMESGGFVIFAFNKNDEKMQIIDPTIFDGTPYNDLWLGKSVIEPDNYVKSEHIPKEYRDLKNYWTAPDGHIKFETTLELIIKIKQRKYSVKFRIRNEKDKTFPELIECKFL